MHIHESTLIHQLVHFEAADRLETKLQLLHYLTAGLPESEAESFLIVCMNPKRRPICRTHIKTGLLVASRISAADVMLPVLLAEAQTFACLRTEPTGPAQPSLADGRLLYQVREAGRWVGVQLVDYLIARLDGDEVYSWRESDHRRS